jgi:hypothetical protein
MSNWTRSNVSREQLLHLVEAGQLPPLTEVVEWIVPADESVPRPPSGYVVSFVVFRERGFSVPADRFIHRVLFAYGLQLQHLNPNNIQQMAAFEAMCEGYHGIGAHWHLSLLHVNLPEGRLPRGDDWLRQPPDEARPRRRLHPGDAD